MEQQRLDPQSLDLTGANILIVDDNPVNLKVLRLTLEEAGYSILVATAGETALRLAAEAAPEAILLDVRMPEMDGYEVCRRLKDDARTQAIPVLFITADQHTEALVAGFDVGGVDYITKPFRKEEVLMRLRTHLSLSRLAGELERKYQELEIENDRKAKELDQARNLQLSMLPTERPDLPHIEIAWYMETATEVGGDYYDYSLSDDGTLTILLGDATGHGLQSGIVVTATKSLFQNLGDHPDIVDTFQIMSRNLKGMNLPRLGMAMAMLKINGYKLRVSSAGIPGILIHRARKDLIEEIEIPGMPLGYIANYDYEEREVEVEPGDTVLLMSDGLPEQRNPPGKMFGFDRAQQSFKEAVADGPEFVCKHLAHKGQDWACEAPQDDDITFVALRLN